MNTYKVFIKGDTVTQLNYYANNSKDAINIALSKEDAPVNVRNVECRLVKTFRFTLQDSDHTVHVDIESACVKSAHDKLDEYRTHSNRDSVLMSYYETDEISHTVSDPDLNTFRCTLQGSNHTETVDVQATNMESAIEKLVHVMTPAQIFRASKLVSCELVK